MNGPTRRPYAASTGPRKTNMTLGIWKATAIPLEAAERTLQRTNPGVETSSPPLPIGDCLNPGLNALGVGVKGSRGTPVGSLHIGSRVQHCVVHVPGGLRAARLLSPFRIEAQIGIGARANSWLNAYISLYRDIVSSISTSEFFD